MKQINPTHQTEKKGLLKVQEIIAGLSWIFRPTPNDDYGIDGEIEPVINGSVTNRLLKIQVKSGASYLRNAGASEFEFVASQNDLDYWKRCNVPVLLIVYDPAKDEAYWKWVQGYLLDHPEANDTMRFSFSRTTDLFSERCADLLAKISNDTTAIADAEPPVQPLHNECLWSNLLKVEEMP